MAELVRRTTDALARLLQPDGSLQDPASGRETPTDHYAATFTSLALALHRHEAAPWQAPLRYWSALAPHLRGHAPFNRLALLLLREQLEQAGNLTPADRRLVESALSACPCAPRYSSNNWTLLAAVSRLFEARGPRGRARRTAEVRHLAMRWFTPAGTFIDAPPRPRRRPVSTPLCYHAEGTMLLWLASRIAPHAVPTGFLERALGVLVAFTDEAALCGGFGRSSHALFGSACRLVLALEGLRFSARAEERARWALAAGRLAASLEAGRRPDGLLPLTPNPLPGIGGGWDPYMHLTVYNAWLAGLVGWALLRPPSPRDPPFPEPDCSGLVSRAAGVSVDERAGLLRAQGAAGSVWLSVRGQPPQGPIHGVADLRWGGVMPFHLVVGDTAVVAPPARLRIDDLLAKPALAGWTPIVESGGRLFALQRFRRPTLHLAADRLILIGRGTPTALAPPMPRGLLARLLEHVDATVLRRRLRRRFAFRPPALRGACATLAFVFDGRDGWFASVLLLRGARLSARLLNPWGRGLLPAGRRLPVRTVAWTSAPDQAVPGALDTHEVPLPCSLPGGAGFCAPPMPWPAGDVALATIIGPATARADDPLPLRIEPDGWRLVTSWHDLMLP